MVSRIRREIEQCRRDLVRDGAARGARFRFPAQFIGFQGHFPGKPVLAGTCQIQCVLTTLEGLLDARVALGEVVMAKFVAPVLPEQEIACLVSDLTEADGERLCRARITREGERVAEFRLRVRLEPVAEGRPVP